MNVIAQKLLAIMYMLQHQLRVVNQLFVVMT